ncbi:hypothetical protein ACJW31_04G002200 [Castanea mollissima]
MEAWSKFEEISIRISTVMHNCLKSISFNFDCLDGNFLEFQGFEATKFANDWKSRLKKKRDDPSEFALTGESLTVTKNLGDGVYSVSTCKLLQSLDIFNR